MINGSGGKKGPVLTAVGNTRDTGWVSKYLVSPKSMIPKGTMPPAKMTPAELKDLVDYLETLKGGK
jgi:cbb3-type cytochrome oxidase cytochrome c subunit